MISKALLLSSVANALGPGEKHADYVPTEPLATITETCTMGFAIEGEFMGEIKIGLYGNVVPKTVKNFATICNQSSGAVDINGKPLLYSNTIFNTIIPNHVI
jgi:hypothetical protein